MAKINSGEHVKKYKFVPNDVLKGIKQGSRLGHFEISDSKKITPDQEEHKTESVVPRSTQSTNHVQKKDKMTRGKKRKRNETLESSALRVSIGARVGARVGARIGAQVGARVRPGPCFTYDWDHRNKPGTVTSLEGDGTVTVEWDATGKSWSGYRVGAVWNGVELI